MTTSETVGNKNEVLKYLIEDASRSIRDIAKKMSSYRQKVWREKKRLEDEHIIWGYTAVVDANKIERVSYLILMKTKPMSRGLADLLTRRIVRDEPGKEGIRVLDFFYVNGEYDWVLRFSAPDHVTARKYIDTLRRLYDEYLTERPVMVDMNFCLIAEGKTNPEIKKLYDFIPAD